VERLQRRALRENRLKTRGSNESQSAGIYERRPNRSWTTTVRSCHTIGTRPKRRLTFYESCAPRKDSARTMTANSEISPPAEPIARNANAPARGENCC